MKGKGAYFVFAERFSRNKHPLGLLGKITVTLTVTVLTRKRGGTKVLKLIYATSQ